MNGKNHSYILGLDLGANSLDWAMIAKDENNEATGIIASGVRVFDSGMDGDFSSGKATPYNVRRRDSRQARRRLQRRARRQRRLAHLLREKDLLPDGPISDIIAQLDKTFWNKHKEECPNAHVIPYWLRAQALDRKLEPYELGRALYHLGQRRGFKSSRKAPEDKEEKGEVKPAIKELEHSIQESGARSLGEYMSRLNPEEERIRARWTGREMFEKEFDLICKAQAAHYPDILTPDYIKEIGKAIFFQRPLKSTKALVGVCEFERLKPRASWNWPAAQRFRLLQQVNNCKLITPDGEEIPLTPEQRKCLVDSLEEQGDLTWAKAKKAIGVGRDYHFTLEFGGEKRFVGNRTNKKLADVFGELWWKMNAEERDDVVHDILGVRKEKHLKKRGIEAWGLSEEKAIAFSQIKPDEGYCGLSRKALSKLLPLMEKGAPYPTAVKEVYGRFTQRIEKHDELPQLAGAMPHLRNPVVFRVLTEVRKVVNSIIREYGKPDIINIELARDLRKTAKQREETWKQNRQNEARRDKAAEKITNDVGIQNPKRSDIEKWLLADECGWKCPYTGNTISMHALFGPSPQFDIEHIIPFSRCLDNSYMNKTLCHHEENRNVKRNQTPYEAYSHRPEKFEEILDRVKNFNGDEHVKREKLKKFEMESSPGDNFDDFVSRQLNDTRYATVEAVNYLAHLYGGIDDDSGRRRIYPIRAGVTVYLRTRDAWDLNAILGDGGQKSRDDHRHHTVDAIATALADRKTIKMLSDSANAAERAGRPRHFVGVQVPWPGFFEDAKKAIDEIKVSHRPDRRVNGQLHEDTFYSEAKTDPDGRKCVHIRKPISSITTKRDIDNIVDEGVRQAVLQKLDEVGGDFKKMADLDNPPTMPTPDGRRIPIKKVRIRKYDTTFPVGDDGRVRNVTTKSNHHMEVIEVIKKGKPRWEGVVVSRYEAMRRLAKREPVVQKDHGPDAKFVCTLHCGDTFEIDMPDGARDIMVVRGISKGLPELVYIKLSEARKVQDAKKAKAWTGTTIEAMRKRNLKKVQITPLGEVRNAND